MTTATRKITYRSTWAQSMQKLREEFNRWDVPADSWGIECQAALSARYYSERVSEEERRVTLTWTHSDGRRVRLSVNAQASARDNLRVLALAVEALRLNEVRGLTDAIQSAYLQLAAPASARDPYEVLGMRPDADTEDIEAMWKSKLRRIHPDKPGGSAEATLELNDAWARIKAERGVT